MQQPHSNGRSSSPTEAHRNGSTESANVVVSNGESDHSDASPDMEQAQNLSVVQMEVLRLIGQHLTDLGLKKAVEALMNESGCRLDHPAAFRFRKCIMEGEWTKADAALTELRNVLDDPDNIIEMRFLLLEQKYLELLESGEVIEALTCLRSQLTPLKHNIERVHHLSSLIFMSNPEELRAAARWDGAGPSSRQTLMDCLQKFVPPTVMMPLHRLESLLLQAVDFQCSECPYHNTQINHKVLGSAGSLLTDHTCSSDAFPSTTIQILNDHCDEIWVARFSPNGQRLATGSKDMTVIIWDVDPDTLMVARCFTLDGHSFGVVYLAWSPDSTKLIVCLTDEAAELVVWDADRGEQICKVSNSSDDSLTCAAWHHDSKRFVCGGMRGQFYQCDLTGRILDSWEGVRIQCLAVQNDGKTVLACDTHHRIRGYHFEEVQDHNIIQEDHSIMTFTINEKGNYALVNVANQGIHLWDLHHRTLVRKFRGLTQGHYTIHSTFGGCNQDFVASGSEDYKIYIWHLGKELPIMSLVGHSKTVNCVTWNPKYHSMLASVSDDNTLRIWGPKPKQRRGVEANGTRAVGVVSPSSANGTDSDSSTSRMFVSNGSSIRMWVE